jgi:hypothetical protein
MRYRELMNESGGSSQSLASRILDILTPIASNGIVSISLDNVISKVQSIPTGLHVDREMLMDILDPNKFPLIKKIEGDQLYLQQPEVAIRSVDDEQKETEADDIKNKAEKQAVKNIKN